MKPRTRKNKRSYEPLAKDHKEIERAGGAINMEKATKRMKPGAAYLCVSCGKQADEYHHPSYREDDRLCVVPLCTSCHIRTHRCGLELPHLGVVPTGVGLVRIAIAHAPV